MTQQNEQLSTGGGTTEEKTVRFESELFQAGFTGMPNLVLLDANLSTAARMVYLGLSYFAREKDECFPGQEKFAETMGISSRTMRKGLRELEEAGLLQSKRRRGRSNIYLLSVPGSGKFCRSVPANSAALDRQISPKSKKKQLEEETEEIVNSEVAQVWEHYCEVFEPQRAKLGPNRVGGIKRALKEVDVSVLLLAIDGLKVHRSRRPGDTSLESIWKTFKGTGSMVERIEFFASQANGSTVGGKTFPSGDPATVARHQQQVQRGHRFQGDPEMMERAERSEAWLREHGIETIRGADGYPTFGPLRDGGAA